MKWFRPIIFLIFALLTAVIALEAVALPPTPVNPYLPYYWITGKINANGAPNGLADKTVAVYGVNGELVGKVAAAKADADGNFAVNAYDLFYYYGEDINLAANPNNLKIAVYKGGDGWGADPVGFAWDNTRGYVTVNLTLQNGQGLNAVGGIRGQAFDDKGIPLPVGTDILVSAGGSQYNIKAEENGYFNVWPVPVGNYTVTIMTEKLFGSMDGVNVQAGQWTVMPNPIKMVSVLLLSGVQGKVVDINNAPVLNVLVTIADKQYSTDADGYVIKGLVAGQHWLNVAQNDPNYDSQTVLVNVEAAKMTIKDFVLAAKSAAGGSIVGTVTDADTGAAVENAAVVVRDLDSGQEQNASTNNLGKYVVNNLAAKGYIVEVNMPGYDSQSKNVIVENGKSTIQDFALVPAGGANQGSVAGKVTDADSGAVLAGAAVRVKDIATGQEVKNDKTDESGKYLINGLDAKGYLVEVSMVKYDGQSKNVIVEAGKTTAQDFALVLSAAGKGSVTGTITDANNGKVLMGAAVSIKNAVTNQVMKNDVTDGMGVYSAGNLPAGSYMIEVSMDKYDSQSKNVKVEAKKTTVQDFALVPASVAEKGSVAGTVTDAVSGLAVPKAAVTVKDAATGLALKNDLTNELGKYVVNDLDAKMYIVEVGLIGKYDSQTKNVKVEKGKTTVQDFALTPISAAGKGSVAGTVFDAASGAEIAGAMLAVKNGATGKEVAKGFTDAFGRYSIGNLDPGEYLVEANMADKYDSQAEGIAIEANKTTVKDFMLAPKSEAGKGSVGGIVTNADTGAVLVNATVVIKDGATGAVVQTVSTNKLGMYEWGNLEPQGYLIEVSMDNFDSQSADVMVAANKITIQDFALMPSSAAGKGSVTGLVTDAITGMPVIGAAMSVKDGITGEPVKEDVTNELGRYAVNDLDPKDYLIELSMAGYNGQSAKVKVEAGNTTVQDFALVPAGAGGKGSVNGIVGDILNGQPIIGAQVKIGGIIVQTDENGLYSVNNLDPGLVMVEVSHLQYDAQSAVVNVDAGNTTNKDFWLVTKSAAGKGSVGGMIVDISNNQPIANADVSVAGQTIKSDAFGNYAIGDINEGSYALDVKHADYDNQSAVIKIESGKSITQNFALVPKSAAGKGSISGMATDIITNKPVVGAKVVVGNNNTQTDANGNYFVKDLDPGPYVVDVAHDLYNGQNAAVVVEAGKNIVQNFMLVPKGGPDTGSIAGKVVDVTSNKPIAGADVLINNVPSSTNVLGEFSMNNLAAGNYSVSVAMKDYDPVVKDNIPVLANATTWIDVAMTPSKLVEGVITLSIIRENDNVKVSWNSDFFGNNPKIYVLIGDGTGNFNHNVLAEAGDLAGNKPPLGKWFPLEALANYGQNVEKLDNAIIHQNQIGADPAEVYYKGLRAGVNDTAKFIPKAPAVGKINVAVGSGYNLISMPFAYPIGHNSMDEVIGPQLHKGNVIKADQVILKDNPASWGMPAAYLSDDGTWKKTTAPAEPTDIVIDVRNGYLINNKGAATMLTFVGDVSGDQTLTMKSGYNMIGTVFPVNQSLNSLGLFGLQNVTAGNVLDADQILIKDDSSSWGMPTAFLSLNGKWYKTSNPAEEAVFKFRTPYGYFYRQKNVKDIIWLRDASLVIGGD